MTLNKWWHYLFLAFIVAGLSLLALVAIAAAIIYPSLPSLEALTDYRPKLPLRVYSEDGYLIDEFGEERRDYIKIEQVPKNMKDAVLAIEDRRFYEHHGVDTKGILRAIKNNLTGISHEGASTITMQVAKNFFTVPNGRRTLLTKINEALLAIKIEQNLSKDKILELYINQIYLGQRSYGFSAASQVYYGKPLEKLNLAETALLAGLPKAPSGYNPYVHPKRAITRQQEVLRDMHRYGFIKKPAYEEAVKQPLRFKASKQALMVLVKFSVSKYVVRRF
jgi:penicillin-binding protein 1A